MSKQTISESQLRSSAARLRDYIAIVESEQQNETAATAGQAVGNAAGTAAGVVAAPVRAGIEAGQAVANQAGKWWDQAKQGVSNFAQGISQGAQQGWAATDPAKLVGGQAAAKTGTTTAKPDPAVLKIQQDLIAKGAKIKADGIMGPATKAAQAQFGGQAAATPQTQTQQNFAAAGMAGQEMRTPAEIAASQDLLSANDGSTTPGAAAQPRNPNAGAAPAAPAAATSESVTYKNEDSLARIIQLSR
jgi:hypothetical protein